MLQAISFETSTLQDLLSKMQMLYHTNPDTTDLITQSHSRSFVSIGGSNHVRSSITIANNGLLIKSAFC